ncbi:glycosyltransferase [Candidatus Roizmanbacteria bacterium]|nr:glycosyltransferase [Candidatus Roizmanbacteria bacterium]
MKPSSIVHISMVIATRDSRKKELLSCLRSIFRSDFSGYEVLVMDNSDSAYLKETIIFKFPSVRYFSMSNGTGIYALSFGLANANGQFVVQLDDDSLVYPDTLTKVYETFRKKPKSVGILTFEIFDTQTKTYLYRSPNKHNLLDRHNFPTFSGNGCAFRKSIFSKSGYYDADFFMYHTEDDLGMRIANAGYFIHLESNIIVQHLHLNKHTVVYNSYFFFMRNSLWFYLKYFPYKLFPVLAVRLLLHLFYSVITRRSLKALLYGLTGILIGLITCPYAVRKRIRVRSSVLNNYLRYLALDFESILQKLEVKNYPALTEK